MGLMEWIENLAPLLLFALASAAAFLMQGRRFKPLEALFAQFASTLGGRLRERRWFRSLPAAEIPLGDVLVVYELTSTGGQTPTYHLQVKAPIRGTPTSSISVKPRSALIRLSLSWCPMNQEMATGQREFDERWIVRARHPSEAFSLLDNDVQEALEELRATAPQAASTAVELEVSKGELVVKQVVSGPESPPLYLFHSLTKSILERARRIGLLGREAVFARPAPFTGLPDTGPPVLPSGPPRIPRGPEPPRPGDRLPQERVGQFREGPGSPPSVS